MEWATVTGLALNGTNGVFARRFDLGGSDGNVFQVNTVAEGDQQHSSVAMDADGDFIITWESFQDRLASPADDVPNSFGVYAQRYSRGSPRRRAGIPRRSRRVGQRVRSQQDNGLGSAIPVGGHG